MSEQLSDLQAELSQKFHDIVDFLRKNAPVLLLALVGSVAGGYIATRGTDVVNAFFGTTSQEDASLPPCPDSALAVDSSANTASGQALGLNGTQMCAFNR
ncbi:MAG TPA: hypothetical protein DCX25_00725 [Candidatus Pacebacteria bacterium]|nr:MAG: hypothetical protein UX00_C0003G0128 [Microgenomates group bacterium GW2011_GWB1_45_17]KKU23184.1 MAG: hypothetical protein UX35_C0009G0008 [Microgenomates group bacterium GW2011_GWA1_46_15]KKU24068.1 MAG: hypothetical protein UX36_C0002G0051 [Microgenomates group bacterium GW2011_GWC1_46_15]HAV14843.1 hypothetical protein [Candidatus Paceibacterota bacterium]HCR11234.1 hypothetical protein [Candidatus Paceibacterota bacterium]